MMILFHSSSTCWAVAVNDYGAIISTLLALSTFSSLFFFAYVLHKTISSRTSEHRLRHQQNSEKQKKKKRKQHGSSARNAKGGGRLRTTEQQRKEGGTLDDNEHAVENLNDYRPIQSDDAVLRTFPPLAEDEPVASLSVPLLGDSVTPSSTTKTSRDESDPLCLPAISTSTLESATNSGDDYLSNGTRSGLSIPTTVVANDVSHLAIGAVLDRRALHITETSRVKAKVNNTGAQNRLPSTNSRRSSRRGKKAAATVDANAAVANASAQAPPASSPSKRWDALKPRSRKCGGRQRLPASAKFRSVRDDPYARFEYDTTSVDSSHSGTNEILMAENRSTSFSPKRDFSFQRLQPPHTHHCASSTDPSMAKTQDSPLISAASATTTALGDQLDGYRNTADQSSPSYLTSTAATGVPVAPFSSLNPQSPSWNDSRSCRLPIRPPPGLETFRNDIPFGCNSSDGGNSAPASPFQSLPSMLDVYHADNTGRLAVPSPFHTDMPTGSPASDFSFLANYEGLYMPPDAAGVSLRFRSPSTPFTVAKQRHLRDNPFATSDEEADEEQIEAELQELGGQMVGSILDF